MHKSYNKSLKKKSLQKKHKNTKKRKLAKKQQGGAGSPESPESAGSAESNIYPIQMRRFSANNNGNINIKEIEDHSDLITELNFWVDKLSNKKRELIKLQQNSNSNTQQISSIMKEVILFKGKQLEIMYKMQRILEPEIQSLKEQV